MSIARHHAEWLSLVETSGPFLSMPVLMRVFPQGLDRRDSVKVSKLREKYEDWLERGAKHFAVHQVWIRHVLTEILEYPPEFLAEDQTIPPGMEAVMANFDETLRPDFVLKAREAGKKPLLLIEHYPPEQGLEKPVIGKIWKASPATRMMELLHATDVPLGLVTNGEQWMLVYAPRGETTGFASWYTDLWMQEPITLRAFHSLLHLRRFVGVAEPETLAALYAESAKDQQEVTEQLGYQVRRAVEMLVQAFDRVDVESNRTLFTGVNEKTVYDGALTVMMRLVFLFCAEERKLLLLGDPLYDQHYAVSTLSDILRERADQHGEEVLERRHDAWCRLLATFRAVYSGVEHEAMRLPAYGGTLFDPDRFPFLEGRAAGTHWRTTPAKPLPINNRVVLHLLEALQFLRVKVPGGGPAEARRLSFRALDVEQIGHVYEGLLDHTAKRADEIILGLAGSRNSEPEIALSKLEELSARSTESLIEFLNEETGRSAKTLTRLIEHPPAVDEHALLTACGQDPRLAKRVEPLAGLLREDEFGQLIVIQPASLYVTRGSERRSTGTYYTPRSLTEPIVQQTLEPLVYIGPDQGKTKAEWKLKSPREILSLKVCDMTMGSGAFLVQTCRYLAERVVEAWEIAEKANPGKILATPEGDFSLGDPKERLIPADPAERLAVARRYVADRCLYGVDINPMAVEMAKLSLWLITLQRDRPFTFLDHALKCGDSLLGVSTLPQIENFSLRPGELQATFATANLFRYVEQAGQKRRELEDLPSNDHTQIETKNRLHAEAEAATAKVRALADCLVALELRGLDRDAYADARETEAEQLQRLLKQDAGESTQNSKSNTNNLREHAKAQLRGRRPFHWPMEFPEVFACGGFDGFVSNPPFMGGQLITFKYGKQYREYLVSILAEQTKGSADLCTYFMLRAASLLTERGNAGLIATNTIAEGETRKVGLDQLQKRAVSVRSAITTLPWPGQAVLAVSILWIVRGKWNGRHELDGENVPSISSALKYGLGNSNQKPFKLVERLTAYKGSSIQGVGFLIQPDEARSILSAHPNYSRVLFPYLGGSDVTSSPDSTPSRWAINFFDWDLGEAERFPICLEIVRERVKPAREKAAGRNTIGLRRAEFWWRYDAQARNLYDTICSLKHVWVLAETSKYAALAMSPCNVVFAHKVIVFCTESFAAFGCLSSSIHQAWIRQVGASLKTDIEYSIADVLETFPLPNGVAFQPVSHVSKPSLLESCGGQFFTARQTAMRSSGNGLTRIYNRFHDRGDRSADIVRLRALQVELDQAVGAAYGWRDLDLGHAFHATKQGERYTISETARRTILGRLVSLNHQRYEEEVKAGLHDKKKAKGKKVKSTLTDSIAPSQPELVV